MKFMRFEEVETIMLPNVGEHAIIGVIGAGVGYGVYAIVAT